MSTFDFSQGNVNLRNLIKSDYRLAERFHLLSDIVKEALTSHYGPYVQCLTINMDGSRLILFKGFTVISEIYLAFTDIGVVETIPLPRKCLGVDVTVKFINNLDAVFCFRSENSAKKELQFYLLYTFNPNVDDHRPTWIKLGEYTQTHWTVRKMAVAYRYDDKMKIGVVMNTSPPGFVYLRFNEADVNDLQPDRVTSKIDGTFGQVHIVALCGNRVFYFYERPTQNNPFVIKECFPVIHYWCTVQRRKVGDFVCTFEPGIEIDYSLKMVVDGSFSHVSNRALLMLCGDYPAIIETSHQYDGLNTLVLNLVDNKVERFFPTVSAESNDVQQNESKNRITEVVTATARGSFIAGYKALGSNRGTASGALIMYKEIKVQSLKELAWTNMITHFPEVILLTPADFAVLGIGEDYQLRLPDNTKSFQLKVQSRQRSRSMASNGGFRGRSTSNPPLQKFSCYSPTTANANSSPVSAMGQKKSLKPSSPSKAVISVKRGKVTVNSKCAIM